MRLLLRILFGLMVLLGLVAGIAVPWAARNLDGYEVGSWRVLHPGGDFEPFEPEIAPSEAPVRLYVYMTTAAPYMATGGLAPLVLSVEADGRPLFSSPLEFTRWPPLRDSPQSVEEIHRDLAGTIDPVDAETYVVSVTRNGDVDVDIEAVDVLLQAGAIDVEPGLASLGYAALGLGLAGFAATFIRRRPKPPPPPPRWGRG